jgi:hypothetical protein
LFGNNTPGGLPPGFFAPDRTLSIYLPLWRWLPVLLVLLAPSFVQAADYLDELSARAAALHLYERREWNRLLHYTRNLLLPGIHGLADARRFYLAPNGKTDPKTELEATLASFFSSVQETEEVQNPQCQFIARFAWLDAQLGFDPARLPRQPCKRFHEWHDALNPAGVSLIFPAAYINNPSSMYGHTLLRIDATDQDEKTRLLAYAINYAANTNETNGIAFAVNGLFGGYPGGFSILPYYLKVREYNDLENRDIWEYVLDLTADEIERLLMHLWELGPIWFDYYFFDENCSYYLLEVLEVARPSLDLTRRFRWWAIPSDTVRALVEQPGLLKRTTYRPSNATVLQHRLGSMDAIERSLVNGLSRRLVSSNDAQLIALPEVEQARVLEVSYDYLNYLRATGRKPVNEPAVLARELLMARSRIAVDTGDPTPPVPEVRPDQGHATSRLALGAGRRDGADFIELRGRPTYHDLMDPQDGYARGAQIEFFDFGLRQYSKDIGFRVEDFRPVTIVSIAPRNEFFQPLSWQFDTGWARRRIADGSEPLVLGVHGGSGLAWTVPDTLKSTTLIYAFIESTLQVDQRLESGFALGAGPRLGVQSDFTARWRAAASVSMQRFFAGDMDTCWSAGLRQRYTLDTNHALRLDLSHERQEKQSWNTAMVSLDWYF